MYLPDIHIKERNSCNIKHTTITKLQDLKTDFFWKQDLISSLPNVLNSITEINIYVCIYRYVLFKYIYFIKIYAGKCSYLQKVPISSASWMQM